MRFVADVKFDRHPLDHDGNVKTDTIESSERTWDGIDANSPDEAWTTTMVRLRIDEPNLVRVTHMEVKPYGQDQAGN